MSTLLTLCLSNTLAAGLLALVALAAARIWKNPHLTHALWVLVLVKLVTPPLASIAVPLPHAARPSTESTEQAISSTPFNDTDLAPLIADRLDSEPLPVIFSTDATDPPTATELSMVSDPAEEITLPERDADLEFSPSPVVVPVSEPIAKAPSDALNASPAIDWNVWLLRLEWGALATWLCGCLVLIAFTLRRCRWFRSLLVKAVDADEELEALTRQLATRLGLRRCPRVRLVDGRVPPLVWRLGFRSQILLPKTLTNQLDGSQLEAVLVHELAHIRRRDDLLRWLEILVLIVNWWNPLAWWARRKLREAEEECCDAWVVRALPDHRRSYGQAMLKTIEYLSESPHRLATAGTAFTGAFYKRRIEMILKQPPAPKLSIGARMALLSVALLVLPVAARTGIGQDQTPADQDVTSEKEESHEASADAVQDVEITFSNNDRVEATQRHIELELQSVEDADRDPDAQGPQHMVLTVRADPQTAEIMRAQPFEGAGATLQSTEKTDDGLVNMQWRFNRNEFRIEKFKHWLSALSKEGPQRDSKEIHLKNDVRIEVRDGNIVLRGQRETVERQIATIKQHIAQIQKSIAEHPDDVQSQAQAAEAAALEVAIEHLQQHLKNLRTQPNAEVQKPQFGSALEDLLNRQIDLTLELKELQSTHGPDHPRVRQTQEALEVLEATLQEFAEQPQARLEDSLKALRGRQAQLALVLKQLETLFGPSHPDVKKIQSEMAVVQDAIAQQQNRYLAEEGVGEVSKESAAEDAVTKSQKDLNAAENEQVKALKHELVKVREALKMAQEQLKATGEAQVVEGTDQKQPQGQSEDQEKRAHAAHEIQLELLRLDVEEAEVELEGEIQELNRLQHLIQRKVIAPNEVKSQEVKVAQARIALKRAQLKVELAKVE